jgi:hypothetical protein
LDGSGWPKSARWRTGDAERVLFDGPPGDFISLEFGGLAPRWQYKAVLAAPDGERPAARAAYAVFTTAEPAGTAVVRDAGPVLVYEQYLRHPRLRWLLRRLELHKQEPYARLEVTANRLARPESAEIFYVRFPLACRGWEVTLDNGGLPFQPGVEQVPGTCLDYFAVDTGAVYARGDERVVLELHDCALMALGGMHDGLKRAHLPDDLATAYAIVYNNIWYTNFAGDEAGTMAFGFDLYAGGPGVRWAPEAYPVVSV